MNKEYVVAVDLGGTKIYTALVDLAGNIINEKIISTEANKGVEVIINNIKSTINYVIDGIDKEDIKAIGIGSPGPLNIRKGLIVSPPNLPFKNYNIVEELKSKYGVPTFLDNDANAATLAEHMFGVGKGSENMVYITVSTGIGGGAILNGKIYRGSTSNALEVGHTTVSENGPRCGCGNKGCSERMSSGTAIGKRAMEAVNSNVKTSLKKYENVTAKEVFIEAAKGDYVANDILNESLSYLGLVVSNVMNTLDPDMIVLGGGVINGGDIVIEKVREVVNSRSLDIIAENCKIEKSNLEGKSGVLGAAALAISELK